LKMLSISQRDLIRYKYGSRRSKMLQFKSCD
jgi:hypothetical protein